MDNKFAMDMKKGLRFLWLRSQKERNFVSEIQWLFKKELKLCEVNAYSDSSGDM